MLPLAVVVIVPFFVVRATGARMWSPLIQLPFGIVALTAGLLLLASTIGLFAGIGKGTLAPWDPTRSLVVRGPYAHSRNPMIAGFGSVRLLFWLLAVLAVNTVYFKLSEEPGLVRRFGGEYELYRRNVPMWVPRLKPWKKEGP